MAAMQAPGLGFRGLGLPKGSFKGIHRGTITTKGSIGFRSLRVSGLGFGVEDFGVQRLGLTTTARSL